MEPTFDLLVFILSERRYGLRLACVERILRAVEVVPVPGTPAAVLGVIDLHGTILPVMNMRRRFGFPEREIGISDRLILANTPKRQIAILVDAVLGVFNGSSGDVVDPAEVVGHTQHIHGLLRLKDGLVLIHDLQAFLSATEERMLDEALAGNL